MLYDIGEYLFGLLPSPIQALIRPEIHHLVDGFAKLERKLSTVEGRKKASHDVLVAIQAEIASEIEDTKAEIERAKRIAARLKALTE
jgi:DNA topoisomerase IA